MADYLLCPIAYTHMRAHTHTHTHTLSLSLSETNRDTQTHTDSSYNLMPISINTELKLQLIMSAVSWCFCSQKSGGYHLDLFIVATLIIICSYLGLPWFVAATVLSINHVNSLKKESQCSAPGEQPKFLGVRSAAEITLIWLVDPSERARSRLEEFWFWPLWAVTASVQRELGRIAYAWSDFLDPS